MWKCLILIWILLQLNEFLGGVKVGTSVIKNSRIDIKIKKNIHYI